MYTEKVIMFNNMEYYYLYRKNIGIVLTYRRDQIGHDYYGDILLLCLDLIIWPSAVRTGAVNGEQKDVVVLV